MGFLRSLGRSVKVGSDPAGDQLFKSADVLADGSTLIRWSDIDSHIYAERFDALGNRLGAAVGLPGQIAQLASGNTVSLYYFDRGGPPYDLELRAQQYNASGSAIGEPVTVNTREVGGYYPSTVEALLDGGYIAVWANDWEGPDRHDGSIQAQIFGADGQKVGAEITVADGYTDDTLPVVAILANGNVAIGWQTDLSASRADIHYSIVTPDGTLLAANVAANTTTSGGQHSPDITALAGGGFVIGWLDGSSTFNPNPSSTTSARAQIFDAQGDKVGGEITVSDDATTGKADMTLLGLDQGGFVAAWREADAYEIRAQLYDDGGHIASELGTISLPPIGYVADRVIKDIIETSPGTIGFVLENNGGQGIGGTADDVETFYWSANLDNVLVGTDGPDSLSGTESRDVISGNAGDDVIFALGGDDDVHGDDGNDSLDGGDGNDLLYGGLGGDNLTGGDGNDQIEGGADNDFLNGGRGDDVLNGGDGNDSLDDSGRYNNAGGSDTLNGGEGNDYLHVYRSSDEAGTTLTLDGGGGDDQFSVNIESSSYRPEITSLLLEAGTGRDFIDLSGSGMNAIISLGADSDFDTLRPLGLRGFLNADGYSQPSNIVIANFAAGDGGDLLDWTGSLPLNLTNWNNDSNPFGSGHARLAQDGADTLLQIDLNGGADSYQTLFRFQNVGASAFTAFNFGGYSPDGTLPDGVVVVGTSGQDIIDGTVAADDIRGEGGADTIHGLAGADLIQGGDGDDYLYGDLGDDTIEGGSGRDHLHGDVGNDILNGGDGDDDIYDYDGAFDRQSGGAGNDRMDILYSYVTSGRASIIDGGTGADDIYATIYGDDHVDVTAGADNDIVTTEVETGTATVTLGDGADTLRIQQHLSYRQQTGVVTVTDFATGAGGDVVDVTPIYNSFFITNRIGEDPFASGHMRLVQYGSDTMLQLDRDGAGQETPYANLVRFQNVDATEFTAAHFGGFTPRVVSAADAATATIIVTGTAVEGNTTSLPLQLVLRDVTRVVTTVTVSFAPDLSTGDSSDATVPALDKIFYLTDLPGGDHAITLPSISFFDDLRAEGTETITVRVRASAEIFENGTDTMDVTIALQDNDFVSGSDADTLIGTEYAEYFDGGAGDDTLSGMGGDDRLDGGAGADRLIGGTGNDIYFADASDTIVERAGEGSDTIYVRSSYALAAGISIETVQTLGSSTSYVANLTGNEFANTLVGNAAANRLDGRAGADVMWGYGGDDVYFVDNAGDKVSELAGGGNDTVYTVTSYTLATGSAVEELRTLGSATTYAADLTGNELANTIVGNAASNRLDGRAGADVMWGYAGDDFYYVDNVGDVVMERAGDGFDTIYAKADFALTRGSSIELLCTFGSSTSYAVNLSGNELANTIYGNATGNRINGGVGADVMAGFGGNDSYYVDNAGDVVIEAAGGGTDTVYAATSYTLAANSAVEELRTLGSSTSYAANLAGNGLANTIVGNAAANMIHGGGGNDSIWGYGGNDQLFGDAGDDSFVFGAGFGQDVIADFVGNGAAAGDTIRFLPGTVASFDALMAKATQQGNDIVFTLDANTSLTLLGTQVAALNAQDFVFG